MYIIYIVHIVHKYIGEDMKVIGGKGANLNDFWCQEASFFFISTALHALLYIIWKKKTGMLYKST